MSLAQWGVLLEMIGTLFLASGLLGSRIMQVEDSISKSMSQIRDITWLVRIWRKLILWSHRYWGFIVLSLVIFALNSAAIISDVKRPWIKNLSSSIATEIELDLGMLSFFILLGLAPGMIVVALAVGMYRGRLGRRAIALMLALPIFWPFIIVGLSAIAICAVVALTLFAAISLVYALVVIVVAPATHLLVLGLVVFPYQTLDRFIKQRLVLETTLGTIGTTIIILGLVLQFVDT